VSERWNNSRCHVSGTVAAADVVVVVVVVENLEKEAEDSFVDCTCRTRRPAVGAVRTPVSAVVGMVEGAGSTAEAELEEVVAEMQRSETRVVALEMPAEEDSMIVLASEHWTEASTSVMVETPFFRHC
jgi:hypothetical protein